MRHGDKINNLGRTSSHRRALLSNLASQLITHKRIVTTLAKAKVLRTYIEPLITKAKENTTHQRRIVFSHLQDKEAITELFGTVAEKVAGRPGGYTRIIKLGMRTGDAAETAMIELVDFNDIYGKGKGEAKEAGKRTRRAGGKKKAGEKAEPSGTASTEKQEPKAEK
jgi:large subunit ribosomal protein L17